MTVTFSNWDPQTKTATVTIQNRYGHFTGVATPDEKDFDLANEWDGYKIAEYQCRVQYYRERAKRLRERYLGVKTAYQNLLQTNESNEILDKLKRQMYVALREADEARDQANRMQENYLAYADVLNTSRKFINQKHQQMLQKKQN